TALGGSRPEQSNQLATGWTFTLIGAESIPGFGGTAHDSGQGAQLDFSIAFPGQRIWMALGFADQAHRLAEVNRSSASCIGIDRCAGAATSGRTSWTLFVGCI